MSVCTDQKTYFRKDQLSYLGLDFFIPSFFQRNDPGCVAVARHGDDDVWLRFLRSIAAGSGGTDASWGSMLAERKERYGWVWREELGSSNSLVVQFGLAVARLRRSLCVRARLCSFLRLSLWWPTVICLLLCLSIILTDTMSAKHFLCYYYGTIL